MNLLDMSVRFVEGINLLLHHGRCSMDASEVERLMQRINEVQLLVRDSERNFRQILKSTEEGNVRRSSVVIITRDKVPICILGEEIAKPSIEDIDIESVECSHTPSFHEFMPFSNTVFVNTKAQLLAIDRTITQAAIEVFDHTYRSYEGFVCFISAGDTRGNVYVIDAIKLRTVIPRLRLLGCNVPKIVHYGNCVQRLLKDFKHLGCYRSYEIPSDMVFIDWRIRPVPEFLLEVLCKGVCRIGEMLANGVKMKTSCTKEVDDVEDIASRYSISSNRDVLRALLRLRRFLAKSNDESVHYVMTDDQVVKLLEIRPDTRDKLLGGLRRLSPLARQHVMDFLYIFSSGGRGFLLQNLTISGRE
ncbi:ribosomal RNA-processing protein 6 [Encephalitozoon cuniculi]|nr:ribosomal RNA-processing protein 6 [Encephalitozoon cuniculi]